MHGVLDEKPTLFLVPGKINALNVVAVIPEFLFATYKPQADISLILLLLYRDRSIGMLIWCM